MWKMMKIFEIYLKGESFEAWKAENGKEAFEILENREPDLVILDLMLPDTSGLNICKNIRTKYKYPIIMLIAKTADQDKIIGLTYGADDYITKTLNPLEVMARVKAQFRRYKEYGEDAKEDSTIYYKGLILDGIIIF
ncbi:Transcriptional regulatory protein YycF [Clostridium ljungdahlii DSM 13528]|uniref:Stage 0 sporulation protein A homolog n=3 Tax=Clostridium TaxID=1485 RepID=D8GKB8_CLOLD|nr:predicted response regulator receiver domain protein [Clostridium ljungdahlii DSM 13528]ALU34714.1 Response regulator receiver protein [Clostridium autoethanogenum DSM 10061]OAA88740.1 Transcriptional regulatory protein YycF [Clostridium ljungdahlii DSM 13528]OVY51433.1 Transcriptional regulatory protein YycF [Clostridium autoethanogenum]